jgi:hypothetical protein
VAAKKKPKTVTLDAPVPANPTRTVVKTGTGGYFRKVESNVKGGVSVPLSTCTAIVSDRNRAGKTAVLDSIRLALAGGHPVGPHAADLAGLTADGSLPWAKLTGDKAEASIEFPSGRKTPKHELTGALADLTPEQQANLLPLVAMRDLLTLGTAKAREELFRRFGSAVSELSAEGLNEAQTNLYQSLLAQTKGDPVQRVTDAGTLVRSHKRALSERLKALEDEKSRLATDSAGFLPPEEVKRLEDLLTAHDRYQQAANLRQTVEQQAAALNEAIEAFSALAQPQTEAEFKALQSMRPEYARLAELKAKVEALRAEATSTSSTARLLESITYLRRLLTQGTSCLVCNNAHVPNAADLLKTAEEMHARETESIRRAIEEKALAESALAVLTNEVEQMERAARAAWQQATMTYQQAQARLRAQADAYQQNKTVLESMGGSEVPALDPTTIRTKLDEARGALSQKERATSLAATIRQVKNEQADAKAVESVLAESMTQLAEGVKLKAQNAVNEWMPDGFRAVLQLEKDGKPECRWEIVGSDGRPHPRGAASGAEWSALAVAIACAWSEGAPYRFLLLDDTDIAGFSAENVRNILHTVSEAVKAGRLTQAFVAWSRPGEIPEEGWSVVAL